MPEEYQPEVIISSVLGVFYNPKGMIDVTEDEPTQEKGGTMYLMSANIRNTPDMPRHKVVRAGEQLSGKAGIIGLQEIVEREDLEDIATGLGPKYAFTGGGSPNPIFYNTSNWTVSESFKILANRKLPGVKGPTFFQGALFQSIRRPNMPAFFVVNTHFVPGAWNLRHDKKEAERTRNWKDHYAKMKRWHAAQHKRGIAVFGMGDLNRGSVRPMPSFHPAGQWIWGHGIDRIWFVPAGGMRARTLDVQHFNTTSDHDAIRATVTVSDKPGRWFL